MSNRVGRGAPPVNTRLTKRYSSQGGQAAKPDGNASKRPHQVAHPFTRRHAQCRRCPDPHGAVLKPAPGPSHRAGECELALNTPQGRAVAVVSAVGPPTGHRVTQIQASRIRRPSRNGCPEQGVADLSRRNPTVPGLPTTPGSTFHVKQRRADADAPAGWQCRRAAHREGGPPAPASGAWPGPVSRGPRWTK